MLKLRGKSSNLRKLIIRKTLKALGKLRGETKVGQTLDNQQEVKVAKLNRMNHKVTITRIMKSLKRTLDMQQKVKVAVANCPVHKVDTTRNILRLHINRTTISRADLTHSLFLRMVSL